MHGTANGALQIPVLIDMSMPSLLQYTVTANKTLHTSQYTSPTITTLVMIKAHHTFGILATRARSFVRSSRLAWSLPDAGFNESIL